MSRSRERHHSAGGLVVRGGEVVLIETRASRWQLPKGHVEEDETPEETAVRETREETGVLGRVVARLPPVEYFFLERGARVKKRVDYFLMDYVRGDVADFDRREVLGAAWLSWEEALRRLTFDNERHVAATARELDWERRLTDG